MATAALTGAPSTQKIDTSVPSGSISNSVIFTCPANTIVIVNFGFNNMANGDVSIRGIKGGGGSYIAAQGIASSFTPGTIDTFFGGTAIIADYSRIAGGLIIPDTGGNGDWSASRIKGALFYMYPTETLCISGIGGPGAGATQFVYSLAGT